MIARTAMMFLLLLTPFQQQRNQRDLDQLFERIDQVRSRLELTPEQLEKIRPILRDEFLKLREVQDEYADKDQNARTRLRMARELKDIRDAADDRLKKILTKKQMEELTKVREENREEFRDRRGQRSGR